MPRYILIDKHSGYIWGDSAELLGKIFIGTPIDFARALDEHLGVYGRTYQESSFPEHRNGRDGYLAYRADINGADVVPIVENGQDQELIDAIERDCQSLSYISFAEE